MAITWQNINGPSLAEAGRPLEGAQRSFDAMFGNFSDILKKREATDAANYVQGGVNNSNAIYNTLYGAKTPEEMAALQQSGKLGEMMAQSNLADRAKLQATIDGRLGALQGQATAGFAFQDAATANRVAPMQEAYKIAALKGDTAGMAAAEAALQGAKGTATALEFGHTIGQRNTTEARATAEFDNKQLLAPLERAAKEAGIAASNAQVETSKVHADVAKGKLEDDRAAREAAKIKATFDASMKGSMFEGGEYSPSDSVELADILAKNKGLDAGEQSRVIDRINKLASEGIPVTHNGQTQNVPIPKALIKGIVAGARDGDWIGGWNEGGANFVEERLKKALEATTVYKDSNGQPVVRSPALDGYQLLEASRRSAMMNPVVGGSGGPKAPGEYKSPKPSKPKKD